MKTYRDILGRINYGLFLAVVFLLPYPQICLRYACVLWIVSWLLEGRWLSRPRSLRENKMAITFLLFGLWYAWKALSGLWAADHSAWAWQMERYLTFALITPVGLWGVNRHYDWQQISRVLILGCTSAVVFYCILMPVLYCCPQLVPRLHISSEWNYAIHDRLIFFSENLSHIKHRLFLCSTEMLGIILAFRTLRDRKAWLVVSVLVMFAGILLSGSRQSILTGAALLAIAMVYALPRRYRLRYGVGILLLGIVLGGGLLMLHPRMRAFNFQAITEMREISYTHDIRFNIWGLAIQTPEDYLSHGIGAGQSTQYMLGKYEQYHLDYYVQKHYHPHNQYLEELIEGGIPGLVLLVLAWLSIPICASAKYRKYAVYFTVLFMINMLTDCMFGKFCGIALWSVGLMLILLQADSERKE